MSNKLTAASVLIVALLIAVAVLSTGGSPQASEGVVNNVRMVDGVQVIDVSAKGGYLPRTTVAKAGVPTVLQVSTSGTFDCSSAVRIPSMGVSKNLPPSGITEIALGTPSVSTLSGTCAMGMYSFQIEFRS